MPTAIDEILRQLRHYENVKRSSDDVGQWERALSDLKLIIDHQLTEEWNKGYNQGFNEGERSAR